MPKSLLFYIFVSTILISCHQPENTKLLIATAANMQFVMKELTYSFTQETGIECEAIISSSGKLTAQIKEGAPYDVFVSANMKYPNDLFQARHALSPPGIYAYGKLVLWSMKRDLGSSLEEGLLNEDTNHIALANPKTAPYGAAAIEVLAHYGILEKIERKLVYGESISQVNQFVISKAAEFGFTAKSVILSPGIKDKGYWEELNPEIYTPIAQGVVLLKANESKYEKAQLFYDFLFSAQAQQILLQYGYEVNE